MQIQDGVFESGYDIALGYDIAQDTAYATE